MYSKVLRVALTGKADSAASQRIEKALFDILSKYTDQRAELQVGLRASDFPPDYLAKVDVLIFSPFDGAPHAHELLPLCASLRWAHSVSAGVDSIVADMLAQKPDVPLTNAKTAYSRSLAEYALAMMLHFTKQVPRLRRNKRGKIWDPFIMDELRGKTVGFVGFGSIAQRTALLLLPWDVRFLVHKRTAFTAEQNQGHFILETGDVLTAQGVDKHTVFANSDIVVCSLPKTDATHHYCDRASFAAMRNQSIFINIGRGTCVDEQALLEVGLPKLKGCALDVFEVEPLSAESPLWDADNVVISPHNADLVPNFFEDSIKVWGDRYAEFHANKPFSHIVDKTAGY
eukprot:GEMP01012547.1.p1 GENE.GEMP01012547.1~~GEMP01012547.1.p1  ORF type:complete len:343 (-),score=93.45 GEMP01012547.1:809-1837(-)